MKQTVNEHGDVFDVKPMRIKTPKELVAELLREKDDLLSLVPQIPEIDYTNVHLTFWEYFRIVSHSLLNLVLAWKTGKTFDELTQYVQPFTQGEITMNTSNLKDKLSTFAAVVFAFSTTFLTTAVSGVSLPSWLLTVAGALASISGTVVFVLTGKRPDGTTKTQDQVDNGNKGK